MCVINIGDGSRGIGYTMQELAKINISNLLQEKKPSNFALSMNCVPDVLIEKDLNEMRFDYSHLFILFNRAGTTA